MSEIRGMIRDLLTSSAHAFTAFILAWADPIILVSGTAAYIAYQLIQEKDPKEKLGDIAEWIGGIATYALVGLVIEIL